MRERHVEPASAEFAARRVLAADRQDGAGCLKCGGTGSETATAACATIDVCQIQTGSFARASTAFRNRGDGPAVSTATRQRDIRHVDRRIRDSTIPHAELRDRNSREQSRQYGFSASVVPATTWRAADHDSLRIASRAARTLSTSSSMCRSSMNGESMYDFKATIGSP